MKNQPDSPETEAQVTITSYQTLRNRFLYLLDSISPAEFEARVIQLAEEKRRKRKEQKVESQEDKPSDDDEEKEDREEDDTYEENKEPKRRILSAKQLNNADEVLIE